ncbi:kinase-like domain, phloem protein 2-like protein [Tanacetum coccineum]|uniref:Kinase-like domain, phloem protein 2-like protein n=1 Tax=Tanacetum coccineum TaxID=301880 RepID=A0ABQ4YPB3_9ASTR
MMFSPDIFAHLKIPLQKILIATNYFDEENLLGEHIYAKKYEGRLWQSDELITICVRRFKEEHEDRNELFWTEVSMLSSLKHKNIVSIIGFCDENDEKIIIYKCPSRASLFNYLSDPMMFTWVRRLEICVGLANMLSYIHYDELHDFSVIHRNINCYTVWINDEWEPMLVDWELSLKIKASQRHHSFHTHTVSVWDREGYADQAYLETKSVNHKSDIYSFGIVMFELLCGRKSMADHQDNKYLTPMAIFHYREKILDEIIDPVLWKQMDPQSFHRSLTSISTRVESHVSKETKSFLKDLSPYKLSFEDIESATNNFAKENIIRKFRVGNIRKGRLLLSEQFIDIIVKSLKHKNLVSLIGFYENVNNKIIIYKKEAKQNLKTYLSDQTLAWMQRLKICIGVAKALSYIHYDPVRDFSVIHCNIRSSKILLDDEWEPQVEVLRGRSAVDDEELAEGLISQLEKSHLDGYGHDPHLRKQMDPESFKIFSETTYYCLQEERAKRPYIDQVVKRLDKALELQWKHENPELPKNGQLMSTSSNYLNDISSIDRVWENNVYLPQKKRSTVAIKRIFNTQGEQGFIAEIETLTRCKHENIISLLGFCDEGRDHMILVYELASKGSLEDYMGDSDKMTNLTWMQRLKICLDIAHGLNYIHTNTDQDKQKLIHRDIKSANILLGDNWEAKIADFGLSKFHPSNQEASTINTDMIAGTNTYLDPEYQKYGRLNKKSDIYSFGVVLLEILTGSLAYDPVYTKVNEKGIAPIAKDHFRKGTLMEIVDHKIKEETDERVFSLCKGPDKDSLDIFSEIALRCVAETQVQRPTIEVVINELKKALYCQENHTDNLKLSLEDVKLATDSFSQDNLIGHGDFGNVYRGHTHGHNIIAAKRLDTKSAQGEVEFMTELKILMEYKHENVIGLLGYCDEEDEKIIVYQYASKGSLDRYLRDDSLTWVMRLKICMDIAIGLEFLHGTVSSPEMVIHRDISSSNILLFDDWKAKISDFGLSLVCPTNQDVIVDNVTRTIGYRDPLYSKTGFLTKEADIFSLGAVLFDILCGKLSSEKLDDEYLYLPFLAKQHYHVGKLDELVFDGIKEQIVPQSYSTFTRIALQCLHHMRERRPTTHEVIIQLKKALEFQEDYEIWEPKLPKDYKEIIQMSKRPENYSFTKKEYLYNIFSGGILIQHDKVLLSFVGNGERNEMVSATTFSYINSCPHDCKSLPESRFGTVVKMLDISNLNIEIKTRAQLLSPNAVYGVYLVFKFCDSRKFSSKPVYVNLKYRKGDESLNAYFATWRDNEWMMIELYRFLHQNEDVVFEFLAECFSSDHCGDGAIYVEGIEFRAIEKISKENCEGLHCPVKVRDILHQENNEAEFVYFITPSPLNVHDITQFPKQREDGWMEIQLCTFNSTREFKDGSLSINMKFTSLEGIMSGLIVCGLEFRPAVKVELAGLQLISGFFKD